MTNKVKIKVVDNNHGNGGLSADQLKQLCCAGAYFHPTDNIQLIETHISWIFLTGEFAYKIKKPLNLEFLDFSTQEKRRMLCSEEVRLNNRFSKGLYLDVVDIVEQSGKLTIGGDGTVIEHAVKMRQFDGNKLLATIAADGEITEALSTALGSQLARVHLEASRYTHYPRNLEAAEGTPDAIYTAIEQNFSQIKVKLEGKTDRHNLQRVENWSYRQFDHLQPLLWERLGEGFVRDNHGDLHLGNITLWNGRVTLFDCIEFNRAFRLSDVQSELAFVLMDLQQYGLRRRANTTLNTYLEVTGDYPGLRLLRFYVTYAAVVRAKVALMSTAGDPDAAARYQRYISVALRTVRPAEHPPQLVLMCGLSGSGKSTGAAHLAGSIDGVRIRSDVERKRLLGDAANPMDKPVVTIGEPYSTEVTQQTYLRLLKLAEEVIDAGYSCIVDATFQQVEQRKPFIQLAQKHSTQATVVHCHAPFKELGQRIDSRARQGSDPSEATLSVLCKQIETFQAPAEAEGCKLVRLDTSETNWQDCVDSALVRGVPPQH